MHWVLAKAFDRPSHLLQDDEGKRIYATFTRSGSSHMSFADFGKTSVSGLDLSMSRHGAGMYFSEAAGDAGSGD